MSCGYFISPFDFEALTCMKMDDSGEDLFITQSKFSTNVATQDAEEAADFFMNSSYDFNAPHSPKRPDSDTVEYLDFTGAPEGGYTVRTEEESQIARANMEPVISIEPTFEAAAPYAKGSLHCFAFCDHLKHFAFLLRCFS